mmetsp:Transcript_110473/g.195511  ORF Transcript_110473/g.195511 Transcript_110473/m.195511 type:complete len:138 (-) Transcript_110473:650-1063(-)
MFEYALASRFGSFERFKKGNTLVQVLRLRTACTSATSRTVAQPSSKANRAAQPVNTSALALLPLNLLRLRTLSSCCIPGAKARAASIRAGVVTCELANAIAHAAATRRATIAVSVGGGAARRASVIPTPYHAALMAR